MSVETPIRPKKPEAEYNPGELRAAEQFPEAYAKSGVEDIENHLKQEAGKQQGDLTGNNPGANVESLKTSESQQARTGGWQNNYTGQSSGTNQNRKTPMTFSALRRRGPLAIIFALLAGGSGFVGLFAPGALIVNFGETMLGKFNDQLAAMEKRNVIIMKKKLAGTATEGICGQKLSLRCRYNSMGNRQVKRLEAAGVKINKKISPIPGRTRIASLEFEGKTITAANFAQTLDSNDAFRSAMIRGYSPKLAGFADKLFGKLAAKLGINKQANVTGDTEEERQKAITDAANGTAAAEESAKVTSTEEDCDGGDGCEDGKRKKYFDEDGNEISKAKYDEIIEGNSALQDEFKARKSLAEAGKNAAKGTLKGALTSTAFGLGAVDSACTGYVIIRTVSAAAQYIGAVQLLRYAQVYMNTKDLIKAGDAKPEQVETVGKILTSTNDIGQSATDSYGYHYAAYDDYSGMPRKDSITPGGDGGSLSEAQKKEIERSDETTKYINGQLVTDNLLTRIIEGIEGGKTTAALDDTCKFIKSGWGQTIVIGTAIVGAVVAFFSGGASLTWGVLAQAGVGVAISISLAMLTPKLIQMASGTTVGKDELRNGHRTGNAVTSGMGAYNHMTSQSRGVPALGKDSVDLVAYEQETQKVRQQYARVDRLEHSPLDPSNPNTFMGSLVSRLVPYTSKMSSLSGGIASMTQFSMTSFASLLPSVSAADPSGQFEVCQDRDYKDMNVAVDPFCNAKHYLKGNPDPILVLDYMERHDYVEKDTETGLPKDGENEYGQYVKNCPDRSVAIGGYTEENDNKGEECIMGSAVKGKSEEEKRLSNPDNNPNCDAGDAANNTECKRNMFRFMFLDASVEDGMENGYASGGAGAAGGSSVSAATPAECTSLATDDLGQIACKAFQFDPYGYKWGGGHGDVTSAKAFMEDFKAGKYTPNQDKILDCSGLVRMAIYEATGVDNGGIPTGGYPSYSKFIEIKNKEDAKPGDILWTSIHTEIVVRNDPAKKRWDIVGAHNADPPLGEQIGPTSAPYSKYDKVFRFQK